MHTVLAGGSQTFFKQVIPDLSASLGTFGPNLLQSVEPTKGEAVVPGQMRLHSQLAQAAARHYGALPPPSRRR